MSSLGSRFLALLLAFAVMFVTSGAALVVHESVAHAHSPVTSEAAGCGTEEHALDHSHATHASHDDGEHHHHGTPDKHGHPPCATCSHIALLAHGVSLLITAELIALLEEPAAAPPIALIVHATEAPAIDSTSPRGPPAV